MYLLSTATVYGLAFYRSQVDSIDRPHINGSRRRTVRARGTTEALHTACLAKEVLDFFRIEAVLGEIILAAQYL
jgi:hypothetical protein